MRINSIPRKFTCLLLIAALTLVFALSCSKKSISPTDNPVNPDTTGLDISASVTVSVGSSGGTLETTGSDNAVYQVVIPPGALQSDVEVTITPYIKSNVADSLGLIGRGIQLLPEGTKFDQPVTIYNTLPQDVTVPPVVALYHISGSDSLGSLLPTTVNGQVLSVSIDHFSSVLPVAPTESQLINYFNALSLTITTFGVENTLQEISALVDGYIFVDANTTNYPGIVLQNLSTEIQGYLMTLIANGVNYCNQGNCIDGAHLLQRVESLAIAMHLPTQYTNAKDARIDCQGIVIDARLTFPSSNCTYLQGGEILPLNVTVYSPLSGGTVANAQIQAWVSGGGTLGSTSGITDALGNWSTTFTAPTTISSEIEIHVSVVGSCDPNYEVVKYINGFETIPINGPVFGWGALPSDTSIVYNGYYSCGVYICGGENDECVRGRSIIDASCSNSGFSVLPSISLESSAGFEFGAGEAYSTFSSAYNETNAVYTLNFTSSANGWATGWYESLSGGGHLNGVILYRKPSNQPFPAGAVLKVNINWGGYIGYLVIPGYINAYWSSGQHQNTTFEIPLTEGDTYYILPLDILGSTSSTSPMSAWEGSGYVTMTIECLNCGL